MNFALFANSLIRLTLHSLKHWFANGAAQNAMPVEPAFQRNTSFATKKVAPHALLTGATASNHPNRPLRVVRIVDTGQSRSMVGRMVISGRMADVCAELDRLAAFEVVPPAR
jgi:hypothetical protein